ncbi:MAG: YqgE/AlgH family protein [Candidatus Binatia bacterium]
MTVPLLCVLLSSLCTPGPMGLYPGRSDRCLRAPDAVAARQGEALSPTKPATGRFLIAKRSLGDPNFAETVILLLNYSERGSMGIIINRPTGVQLASALPKIKELRDRPDRVFMGGPVMVNSMLLLIRSGTRPTGSQLIFGDVYASGSLGTLHEALGKAGKTERLRAYAGYAGWGPGQLDHEIDRGDWLVAPADTAAIFDATPSDVWRKLLDRFSVEWAREGGRRPRSILLSASTDSSNLRPGTLVQQVLGADETELFERGLPSPDYG